MHAPSVPLRRVVAIARQRREQKANRADCAVILKLFAGRSEYEPLQNMTRSLKLAIDIAIISATFKPIGAKRSVGILLCPPVFKEVFNEVGRTIPVAGYRRFSRRR